MCIFKKKKKKPTIEIPELPKFIEGEEIDDFEYEVMTLLLFHRKSKGLKLNSIRNNTLLNRIATIHSKYMAKAKKASHDDFPERDRNCRVYTQAKSMKEIVAGGYGTAPGVVKAWLKSSGHRKAIEWKEAKEYGISIEKGTNNQLYYTVIFIKK